MNHGTEKLHRDDQDERHEHSGKNARECAQRRMHRKSPHSLVAALTLVPMLRLGTPIEKLCFSSDSAREAELANSGSQAELGNQDVEAPLGNQLLDRAKD